MTLIGLLSLMGGWIIFYGTAVSPWGGSDATEYLVSARYMLRGVGIGYYTARGVFVWIRLHPPFYPMVLGAVSLLGMDLINAARWLDILMFALSIGLTGFLFWRFSSSRSYGLLASLLILAFSPMLKVYTMVMSEPLFIFTCVLHSLLLILFFRTSRLRWLLLSALAAGLAFLTRYVGAALIGAGALSIFLFYRGKGSGRFWKSSLYLFLACLPLSLWFSWSYFGASHSLAGRTALLDLSGLLVRLQPYRVEVVDILWSWLPWHDTFTDLHYRVKLSVEVLIVVIPIVLTIIAYSQFFRKAASEEVGGDLYLLGIFGLFALAQLAFLGISSAFTAPLPIIDDRLLLPVYLSSLIALLAAFSLWSRRWFSGFRAGLKIIPWLLAAFCIFQYVPVSAAYIAEQHFDRGLRAWENTAIINAVRALPANMPIITTRPNVLLLWADRPAYGLTVDFSSEFLAQTGPYGSDPQDPLQKIFREDGAALVDFNDFSPQFIQKYGKDSVPRLNKLIKGLIIYKQTPEGVIYLYPK